MPVHDSMSPQAIAELNPLQLAYVGDSVFGLLVRGDIFKRPARLQSMHKSVTSRVNAAAQARALERIAPLLLPEEEEIVRRGRNAHARHQAPKSASLADYAASTALEALFGWLYVSGQEARLKELFECTKTKD